MERPVAGSLTYQPSLDGIRAIAIGVVLLYHSDLAFAKGGFLGVSVFFTLSGYLITSLLLDEGERTGRIAPGRFWGRRFRRLAPAALAAIALVTATARWWATPAQQQSLVGDAWAAIAQVANWRFITEGQSYADLFRADPSTLAHFWSLAVEQQVYLAYPLVMLVLVVAARRARWTVPVVLAGLAVASAMALVLTTSRDLAYYGTHTRAAEFLVGGLLATVPAGRLAAPAARRPLVVAGWLALGALAALVVTTELGADWLYAGGFPALGVLWCVLVAGALASGSLRTVLSWRPLVAVGAVSYGLYLYHWPVFLALDPERVGFDGPPLAAVRVAVATVVTVASYHWLERPVRERRWLARPGLAGAAYGLAAAAVAVAVVVVPWREPAPTYADAPDEVIHFGSAASPGARTAPRGEVADGAAQPDADRPRVLLLGSDVVGRNRLRRLAATHALEVVDRVTPGCPVVHDLQDRPDALPLPPGCAPVESLVEVAAAVDAIEPVDVVVVVGLADFEALEAVRARGLLDDDPHARLGDLRRQTRAGLMGLAHLGGGAGRRVPVLLADPGIDTRLSDVMNEVAIASEHVQVLDLGRDDAALWGALSRAAGVREAPERLRVMVIGDSTSYGVAVELDRQAGDRLQVVWAGRNNCPLVPVDEVHWWEGASFASDHCPRADGLWAEVAAQLQPDVILAVSSLPEQSRQRYPGDPRFHEPGEPAYVAAHDQAMADLQRIAAASGAVVLLTDAPPITFGAFAKSPMARPERQAAWNAQLARWDQQWQSVAVIPWTAPLLAAEEAAGRSLRTDGVHIEPEALARLVRDHLAPTLVATTQQLRSQLAASGCLVHGPQGRHLDLAACTSG